MTFQASCRPMLRTAPSHDPRPIRGALQPVCARAVGAGLLDEGSARRFFESKFVPVRIRKLGDAAGFLTGYYEPIVEGSRVPTREFTVPLYRRPPDLIAAGARRPAGRSRTTDLRSARRPMASSFPITIAAKSKTGRLTASILRFAGCAAPPRRFSSRSRVRRGWRLEEESCCVSITMRIMAIRMCRWVAC